MAIILNLETATHNCSVALAIDGVCVALVEQSAAKFVHAEKLHNFIAQVLAEAGKKMTDLEAVAVSNGPGSYTGLRIGISAAKGLCYALNIPMIALNTNDVLAASLEAKSNIDYILSVIDARRNEVYARLFDSLKKPLTEIKAVELDENSYPELKFKKVSVVGDAANKTVEILGFENLEAKQQFPTASAMCQMSAQAFLANDFVDVAYHEPFYLKDFIAGKPKKLL